VRLAVLTRAVSWKQCHALTALSTWSNADLARPPRRPDAPSLDRQTGSRCCVLSGLTDGGERGAMAHARSGYHANAGHQLAGDWPINLTVAAPARAHAPRDVDPECSYRRRGHLVLGCGPLEGLGRIGWTACGSGRGFRSCTRGKDVDDRRWNAQHCRLHGELRDSSPSTPLQRGVS